ncbi:coronin [Echinococcus multilocularis]|uniref:Coronin n=1 Tax=Echinococcus multilocularis TaxID=6211 RepID=A0A0S4MNZ4_ECHMU|nr:coronin [Echinococcus multilocularis]
MLRLEWNGAQRFSPVASRKRILAMALRTLRLYCSELLTAFTAVVRAICVSRRFTLLSTDVSTYQSSRLIFRISIPSLCGYDHWSVDFKYPTFYQRNSKLSPT